jgi:hydroxysqualene synthase
MTLTAAEAASGKSHRDENFPVASRLIAPRHRGPILAFYDFVRAADDVSDHAELSPEEKIRLLDGLGDALTGRGPADPAAEPLRRVLAERGLSPRHALDLLEAFRTDARKNRYRDWDDLIGYCALSAMPVGRYVLDVHGEDPDATWAASDAICAALQVLNHLQDCGKDFRSLDRVYLPADALARHGADVAMLAEAKATPQLRAVIADLAEGTLKLLDEGRVLPARIADTRLALEIAAIHGLAVHLTKGLTRRDPLSERVHHGKAGFALVAAGAIAACLARRPFRSRTPAPARSAA